MPGKFLGTRCLIGLILVLGMQLFGSEIDEVGTAIKAVLPEKGWTLAVRNDSVVVSGPEVQTIWPISLPSVSGEELWRDYALPLRIEVIVSFGTRISDNDLAELRRLHRHFYEIIEQGVDKREKDWGRKIKEFGSIHLPDYRSAQSSVFVHRNTDGHWVRPQEALDIVAKIEKVLAGMFVKVPDDEPEDKNKKKALDAPPNAAAPSAVGIIQVVDGASVARGKV